MATSIYLDVNTERLIEEHKKNNPEFNLSGFIQKMVKEYSFEHDDIDITKVDYEISQSENEIDRLERKILYLKEKKKAVLEKRKTEENKKQEDIESYIDSIIKYCDVPKIEAVKLAHEYFEVRNKFSLVAFIQDKGYSLQ